MDIKSFHTNNFMIAGCLCSIDGTSIFFLSLEEYILVAIVIVIAGKVHLTVELIII